MNLFREPHHGLFAILLVTALFIGIVFFINNGITPDAQNIGIYMQLCSLMLYCGGELLPKRRRTLAGVLRLLALLGIVIGVLLPLWQRG